MGSYNIKLLTCQEMASNIKSRFFCAALSLNTVGVNAVESSSGESVSEPLKPCMLFSPHTLSNGIKRLRTASLTQKSLSCTIWASDADSKRALHENDGKVREALEIIAADDERRQDTSA